MEAVFLVKWICLLSSVVGMQQIIQTVLPPEKECGGMGSIQMGFSGTPAEWFTSIKNAYRDCTYIEGNLVLTWMTDPNVTYDLSFLHNIKYVRGYVIIAINDFPDVISLPNLEIIRGNSTFKYKGERLSLFVGLNEMTELRLPKLREISNGGVNFVMNRNLCHVQDLDWNGLMAGRLTNHPSSLRFDQVQPSNCLECSEDCDVWNGNRLCWSPHQCQILNSPNHCQTRCPRRCYRAGFAGCCNPECAAGCYGPSDTQCYACKNYKLFDRCVSHCPYVNPRTYPIGQICIEF